MALLFRLPKAVALQADGTGYGGAKANFYLTGTTTPTDTYTDSALTTAHANPVVADSNGVFEAIYLDPDVDYKLTLTQSDDTLIYTVDPVNEALTSLGATTVTKSANYTVDETTDQDLVIEVDATATITLPTVADAGEGFRLLVMNSGSGIVTIDGEGSETILNGSDSSNLTVTLSNYSSCLLTTNGTEWMAHVMGAIEQSYTASQTGYASSLTPTVVAKRSGSIVSLYLSSASTGTSNATTMTLTGPGAPYSPASTVVVPCFITDNGTQALGLASVASSGTVTFGADATGTGNFTASGTKGLGAGTLIVYDVG